MTTHAGDGEDGTVSRLTSTADAQKRATRADPAWSMSAALASEAAAMGKTRVAELKASGTTFMQRAVPRKTDTSIPPKTAGLALSGGGIRSATFGLGVLQALATSRRLGSFDYMSTVSGGGYIGSWLSAWIYRAGLHEVQDRLGERGYSNSKGSPTSAEPSEVTWLRRYSNYLSPRVGLLSFDSLTLLATWWRNVALNAVVILGFLCAVMVLPFLLIRGIRFATEGYHYVDSGLAAAWSGIVFLAMTGYNLWKQSQPSQRSREWAISTPGVLITVILPAAVTCCMAAIWLMNDADKRMEDVTVACGVVAGLVLGMFVVWGFFEMLKPRTQRVKLLEFLMILLAACAAFAAGLAVCSGLYLAWHQLSSGGIVRRSGAIRLLMGPPLLLFALSVSTTVFTGLVGRLYFERSREWWSRLNAWLIAFGAGWMLWIGLAFLSFPLLVWVQSQLGGWVALLGTGWIVSLLTAVLFKKPETASKKVALKIDGILNIAAVIFIAGLLVVIAAATGYLTLRLSDVREDYRVNSSLKDEPACPIPVSKVSFAFTTLSDVQSTASFSSRARKHLSALERFQSLPSCNEFATPDVMLLALLLVLILFSARVDVNKFSLHNMYKNRLVRCYLGASNQATRNEQPFTGLDDDDDLLLAKLGPGTDHQGIDYPAQRPMHILNAALNITQGSNLAWQERKAASFIFTPIVCGYSLERTQGDSTPLEAALAGGAPSYRPTAGYGGRDDEEKGFSLGMALATSGAAVSPNMGHASSPARAFLLTLFNVRLGRWSANPAATTWQLPSPRFGLVSLLQELFGYSNEGRNFVYLSDGGHFDNLGVYELVRRRCATIFAVDAGADPDRKMDDLAETVRKCRVDLGVEVELTELKMLKGDSNNEAPQGFMRGRIRYDLRDASQDGILIVIKPTMSLAHDEPVDVLNYAQRNLPFPQQTTSDQFFDESQFEAYRRLGLHIASECLKEHAMLLPEAAVFLPPVLPAPVVETQAWSTRIVAYVLRLIRGDHAASLPAAEGNGWIDIHLCFGTLLLLLILGFAIFDPIFLGRRESICFTSIGCLASLQALFSAGETARMAFAVHVVTDNVFVLIYSAFFATGFIAASKQSSTVRLVLPATFVLLAATALVDTVENIRMLRWLLVKSSEGLPGFEGLLVMVSQAKFLLGASLIAIWLLLSPLVVQAFRIRWSKPHKFGS